MGLENITKDQPSPASDSLAKEPPTLTDDHSSEDRNTDRHSIINMSLRTMRFVVVAALAFIFSFAFATVSNMEWTLTTTVAKGAEDVVENYNTVYALVTFSLSKLYEIYLDALIFPTLETYLHNCHLFPGDDPKRVRSHAKSQAIFWGLKLVIILMTVSFTSIYVTQRPMRENDRRLESLESYISESMIRTHPEFHVEDKCGDFSDMSFEGFKEEDVDSTLHTTGFILPEWSSQVDASSMVPSSSEDSSEFTIADLFLQTPRLGDSLEISTLTHLWIQGQSVLHKDLGVHGHAFNMDTTTAQKEAYLATSLRETLSYISHADLSKVKLTTFYAEPSTSISILTLNIDIPVTPQNDSSVHCGDNSCVLTHQIDSRLHPKSIIGPWKTHCEESEMDSCVQDDTSAFVYSIDRSVDIQDNVPTELISITLQKISLSFEDVSDVVDCDSCTAAVLHLSTGQALYLKQEEVKPAILYTTSPPILPSETAPPFYTTWTPMFYIPARVCNPLVDAFTSSFPTPDPLLPLTYLFRHAHVASSPSRRLKDGYTTIMLEIPGYSSTASFSGCAFLLVMAIAVVWLPTSRVKVGPNTTPAAQYVQILTDDLYPDLVHKKRLRFPNGDGLLFNEYIVDGIVLHAKKDERKKIVL